MPLIFAIRSNKEKRRPDHYNRWGAFGVGPFDLHGTRWECSGERFCFPLRYDRSVTKTHDIVVHGWHEKMEQLLASKFI